MRCYIHEQEEAAGSCVHCGKLFCSSCLVELDGRNYCKEHANEMFKTVKKGYVNSFEPSESAKHGIYINNNLNNSAILKTKSSYSISPIHGFIQVLFTLFMFMFMFLVGVSVYNGIEELFILSIVGFLFSIFIILIDKSYIKKSA